jgi:hypothetical protein
MRRQVDQSREDAGREIDRDDRETANDALENAPYLNQGR